MNKPLMNRPCPEHGGICAYSGRMDMVWGYLYRCPNGHQFWFGLMQREEGDAA